MLLESMRKGVSKILIQILALLLIASFALWGVGDMVGVISNPDEIATVDGNRLSSREFQRQFRGVLENARQRYGAIDYQQARALGLADSALDGMVSRYVLDLEAGRLGLRVGDDLVADRIRREPAFRNAAGEFDRASYQAVLANSGYTEGTYAESIRGDLRRGFLTAVASAGVTVPDVLVDTLFRFRNERRSTEFLRVDRKPQAEAPAPSDADLAEYFGKNAEAFRAPEYRRLALLWLDPEEIAGEMEPDSATVREEYENRRATLAVPERRHVEQIVTPSEDAAKALHARLSAGGDFAPGEADESARKTSLGAVARADLPPAIADAAFALDSGAISAPVRTPLGWHVVKVGKIEPGSTPSFEEVEKRIRDDLARELALDSIVGLTNRIEDTLAGGGTLEEAASAIGARVRAVGPVDAGRATRDGKPVSGAPSDARFIEAAFSTEAGETSDLIDTADGGYFLLRVEDVVEPADRPLDEVRDDVRGAWQAERLDEAAKERAEGILERARAGTSFATLAEDEKLKLATGGPVDRFGAGAEPAPPRGMLAGLFEATERDPFVSPTAAGYVVARVTAIDNPEPDRQGEDYLQLQDSLTGGLHSDLLDEYSRALRSEYDVVINAAAFDALFETR